MLGVRVPVADAVQHYMSFTEFLGGTAELAELPIAADHPHKPE